MAEADYQVEAIGEIYAQALINVSRRQGVLAEVQEDVASISELYNAGGLFKDFIEAVDVPSDIQRQILEKMLSGKVNQLTLETLKSMALRNRLMFLHGFIDGFLAILARDSGQIPVELISAHELSGELAERLKSAVAQATGKAPNFKTKVDPSLIGGVRVKIGDTLIDASVEAQLEKICRHLKTRGTERVQKNMAAIE